MDFIFRSRHSLCNFPERDGGHKPLGQTTPKGVLTEAADNVEEAEFETLKSTGPKTAKGRARASQNARTHGLTTSMCTNASLKGKLEKLARTISGPRPSAEKIAAARRVAEALVSVDHVQRVRQLCVNDILLAVGPSQNEARNQGFLNYVAQLIAIDRYERRALSRRKFAIRDFDAAKKQEGAD